MLHVIGPLLLKKPKTHDEPGLQSDRFREFMVDGRPRLLKDLYQKDIAVVTYRQFASRCKRAATGEFKDELTSGQIWDCLQKSKRDRWIASGRVNGGKSKGGKGATA